MDKNERKRDPVCGPNTVSAMSRSGTPRRKRAYTASLQKRHVDTMPDRSALQCGERQQRHPRKQDRQKRSAENLRRLLSNEAQSLLDSIGWPTLCKVEHWLICVCRISHGLPW